jgi:copper chaperone NosL
MRNTIIAGSMLLLAIFGVVGWTVGARDDIDLHRSCEQCGMDRKAFGYSRMLVIYEDGASVGVCSLNCAVVEIDAHKGRKVKSLLVADRDSKSMIDAEKAVWVMGGKKRGVMTSRPKWAFETKSAAQTFIDGNGGETIGWTEVLAAAREDAAPKPR